MSTVEIQNLQDWMGDSDEWVGEVVDSVAALEASFDRKLCTLTESLDERISELEVDFDIHMRLLERLIEEQEENVKEIELDE